MELMATFDDYVSDVNVYDIFGICYGPEPHPQIYQTNAQGKPTRSYSAQDYTPWAKRSNKD